MTQLWQFGSKSEEEINAEIKKMFSTTQKRHVSLFGSNSQDCIHLLKIIAGITSDSVTSETWSSVCEHVHASSG
jgi:hypothetical protein